MSLSFCDGSDISIIHPWRKGGFKRDSGLKGMTQSSIPYVVDFFGSIERMIHFHGPT
jgi:hypothetical protein